MDTFEILCATMGQKDFSKIDEMNIRSNVVFANQCNRTAFDEIQFGNHTAKMISTQTRGVGVNRNLALLYASADICLLADDDVVYKDNMEEIVLREFDENLEADIIIFHLDTESENRKQKKYDKTRKCGRFEKMPWGACRIAFRLDSVRKANVWFTTLFGGGCVFPSGEDSMWLTDAKRKGLTFYVSKETIGTVSFEQSTWFTGADEKYYYGKGAYYAAVHNRTFWVWAVYFATRTRKSTSLGVKQVIALMVSGRNGYRQMITYKEFCSREALNKE